ncbi:MAG TPA: hypothetical protein VM901_13365 [Bdellovibrionota bacterium]|nr:hypothetical protein [Bdellovibrionota bacterium]
MKHALSLLVSTLTLLGAPIAARAMVPMNLSTSYTSYSSVAEHRAVGQSGDNFALSQFDFTFGLRTFNDPEYRAHLQVGLPLRTLQMNSGTSSAIGSELGGWRLAWNQSFYEVLGWDLSYIKNASSRLGLFAENQSLESIVSLRTLVFPTRYLLVRAHAGPGLRLTSSRDTDTRFGPMLIGRAGVELIMASESIGKIALGLGAMLRQRTSYHDAESGRGGERLVTLQPNLAWEVVPDLWVTAQYTRALVRPEGREQSMGDVSLGGLYGDSLSFGISTASF